MTPETLTGCPDNLVGENFAPRAAATLIACNSGWPETAWALTTFPFSSTSTCTTTVPAASAARAIGGYCGCGKLIAFPLSTPAEIGARAAGVDAEGDCIDAGGGGG